MSILRGSYCDEEIYYLDINFNFAGNELFL